MDREPPTHKHAYLQAKFHNIHKNQEFTLLHTVSQHIMYRTLLLFCIARAVS